MRRLLAFAAAAVAVFVAFRLAAPRPRVTNSHPRGENIICFGDSLTAGTGAGPGESYPDRLATFTGRAVINAGVPGDTTATALERLERDVLARSPRIVCITLGGNDLKNGVPREEAFAALETIVRRIQAEGALVVVGGIDVPLLGRGFDDGYHDLARRTGAVLIPDVLDGLLGHRDLMSDAIHPNGAGYARVAERFHAAIKPYL